MDQNNMTRRREEIEFIDPGEIDVRVRSVPAVSGVTVAEARDALYGGYLQAIVDDTVQRSARRFSPEQIALMKKTTLPSDDAALKEMLRAFPFDWRKSYMAHNKLVRPNGYESGEIVPRLPALPSAAPINSELPEDERRAWAAADKIADRRRKARVNADAKRRRQDEGRTYNLVSVFEDSQVAPALALTADDVTVAAKLAAEAPVKAVEFLYERCRENGIEGVRFNVGGYAKNRKAFRRQILSAAEPLAGLIYDVQIADGEACICSDARDAAGNAEWSITGSVWQMPEIDALHRMCIVYGPTNVGSIFEQAMVVLGIQFLHGGNNDYGIGLVQHAGLRGQALGQPRMWGNSGDLLPEAVREFSARLMAFEDSGDVLGSAILVKGNQSLINWHVVESASDANAESVGVRLSTGLTRVSMLTEFATDVWWAEVDLSSSQHVEPAAIRRASVGEKAVMIYATPLGVRFSDEMSITRVENSAIVAPRVPQAMAGTSGAALIAISDGNLLGMYRGSNEDWSVFTSLVSRRVRDRASVAAALATLGTREGEGTGRVVYDSMVMRGLGDRLAAIVACIEPLYARGRQVGSGFCVAGKSYTSMHPDLWSFTDAAGNALEYLPTLAGGARERYDVQSSGVKHRVAVLDEMVVVVARDTAGDVVFSSVGRVSQVGNTKRRFRLTGISAGDMCSLESAVVVAVSDACAIGQVCGETQAQDGVLYDVNSWHVVTEGSFGAMEGPSVEDVRQKLASQFHYLQVDAWTGADLQSLCSPTGEYPASLRAVGERASRALVVQDIVMRLATGVSHTVETELVEPGQLRAVASMVFPSSVVSELDKVNALECAINALFGVVVMREGNDSFAQFLTDVGLLGGRGRLESREPPGFAALSRRASSV